MSRLPIDKAENLMLKTFAGEKIGETPSSPLLVTATPRAEIKRLMIKRTYRPKSSLPPVFLSMSDPRKKGGQPSADRPIYYLVLVNFHLNVEIR